MEKKSIGAFIAILRKSSGMTQKDLAERLGVSDKTVSHWERDESAPDLTLIPVIAEIFGVTCDELLRGERIKAAPEEPLGKTEKQIKHLLGLSRGRFKTRSMISLGLSIAGLFAALICNFGFNRAYIGFLIGCVFWAAAIICESVFYSHAYTAVSADEFEGADLNDYRIYAVRIAEKMISAAAIMFAASLPLIFIPSDTFQGVTAEAWLAPGLLLAAAAAVIGMFAVYIINNSLIKKGVYTLDKEADVRRHKIGRLKVRCAAFTAAVLFALFIAQAYFNSTLGADAFAAGTAFDNFEDFKAYMETEKPGEGGGAVQLPGNDAVKYFDINGNPITETAALTEFIYDNNGNVLCQYVRRNNEVAIVKYGGAGADVFPITTYTSQQLRSGQAPKDFINACMLILYFIAAGTGFLVYFRKRAVLKKGL